MIFFQQSHHHSPDKSSHFLLALDKNVATPSRSDKKMCKMFTIRQLHAFQAAFIAHQYLDFIFLDFSQPANSTSTTVRETWKRMPADPSAGGRSAFSHTNYKGPKEKQKQAEVVHKCPSGADTGDFVMWPLEAN